MTISTSEQDWADWEEESFQQAQYPDSSDQDDQLMQMPTWLAEGSRRRITLRDGLSIEVDYFTLRDRWKLTEPEKQEALRFHCHLSGNHTDAQTEVGDLDYALYGSGVFAKQQTICSGQSLIAEITISMEPDALIAFAGRHGELPPEFQHLIRFADQQAYARVGSLAPTMQQILQQILRCPYQGMTKRMYLESKALEIASLILEQERDVQQGRRSTITLKSDEVDRIHQARAILLQNLHQPPSLSELARQVGLNDNALKRGFRACFGKPVFGYLLDYRMEQAQQLLMTGELRVGEVMQQVGIRDRQYFAATFRERFGANPRDYRKVNLKKSV
jgi:AraC-like DNA-binding protein